MLCGLLLCIIIALIFRGSLISVSPPAKALSRACHVQQYMIASHHHKKTVTATRREFFDGENIWQVS